MKKIQFCMISALLILYSAQAFSCSDCEDEIKIGPIKGCLYNVNRCPPPAPPPVTIPTPKIPRTEYCNVSPTDPQLHAKPSCTNCSSLFSGDAGKIDCLGRHQGDHVDFGACKPEECSNIIASPSAPRPVEATCIKIPEGGAVSFPKGAWHEDPGRNSWNVDPGEEIRNDGKDANGYVKFFSVTKNRRWATPDWAVSDNYCFYQYK